MSHQVSYSKLFAPPRFLEMSFVAIEITSTGISFMTTEKTRDGLMPDVFGIVPLVPGEVISGEVVKREEVVKALIVVKKKTGCDFVRFSLPEEKTYIFKLRLPKLEPHEIHDIIDFKIEENIPLTSKEAVFDYDFLPVQTENSLDVVVSVAPAKVVEDYNEIFKLAGLTPVLFSPESNNLAKSLIRPHNLQSIVVAHIRESNIVLSLVSSGIVCQTSSINFGSSTFNELLAKYYKTSIGDVIKIKKDKLYRDNEENSEVFSHIINTISAIKDEVARFVDYSNQKIDGKNSVKKIILAGPDAMLCGLHRYLSANLGLPVEIGDVWLNNFDAKKYLPEIARQDSLSYAVVNGLNLI
jgi:type IV pilus assembly protein PilM